MGKVLDSNSKEGIPDVNILIKNVDGLLLSYTISDVSGNFVIELLEGYDKLIIETSIISHLPIVFEIFVSEYSSNTITLQFDLEERVTELEEIYIEGEKKPITVKKDTTVYSVNQFKDGSERVVEDILKKLPGITVGDNGVIKFKGKQVTRVLLDNDNIFDSNYTIGTKNISSDIIEAVQAIEDYNSNPLLKGIKSSEEVAVNLILKKGKTDVSGNAEIGLGVDVKKLLRANALSVSKKLKGFSTISYNNIGENYSPYNFVSNNFELSKINEFDQRTNNLVNTNGFNSNLPDNRISVNSNFFGSINALYKITEKLSFRGNYNVFIDKLLRNENQNTTYNFDNQELNISLQENIIKRPLVNTFNYELIYNINKKSLLTSSGKWDSQTLKKASDGFNNSIEFKNLTKSEDIFYKNDIEYTYKINKKNVFQLFGSVASNDIPQSINISNDADELKQTISFKKNYFKIQSSLLSKTEKSEYAVNLGYNFIKNYIDSKLQGITVDNQYLVNDNYYKTVKLYAEFNHQFRIKKWRFTSQLMSNLYDIKLTDTNLQTKYTTNFINLQPKLSINYYLNNTSYLYTDYTLSNQLPDTNKIYSGLILIDNRSLVNNDFSFNLFNYHSSSFGYRINDFYNLFQFNVYGNYNFQKQGYINQLNIDENTNFYTSIVDVTNNKSTNFGLDVEKYLHLLRSTFNINSSYSITEYRNIINDSELRNNKSKSLFGQFSVRTGFQGRLNFENKILFRNNVFSNSSNTSNSFTSFQNEFKTKFITDRFQFVLNSQYFKPDLSNSNAEGDLFLDATMSYKPKNGKIEYQLKADNLLNNKTYRNIDTSDFSNSIFEYNLQERFLLLSIQFKF